MAERAVAERLREKYLAPRLEKMRLSPACNPGGAGERVVWQYWGQGAEKAPEIVKIALNSVSSEFGRLGYEVRVLTDDTVGHHLDINPKFHEKALRGNGFSLAAYSDLLRAGLLHRHGGIWLDATIFISGTPEPLLSADRVFYERSAHTPVEMRRFAQTLSPYFRWGPDVRTNWLSSIIKTPKNDPLMGLLWDILNEYWERESVYEHYFLIHLLFDLIRNREPLPNYECLSLDDLPPHLLQFAIAKNEPEERIRRILTEVPVHKLTYKISEKNARSEDSAFNRFIRTNGFSGDAR